MSDKIQLGKQGESIAAQHLQKLGYRVVATNHRTPFGELDLICRYRHELVFVEVKTRTGRHFGDPETAITPQKMSHLVKAAEHYRRAKKFYNQPWRIDVVAIDITSSDQPVIKHFENAVQDWPTERYVRSRRY